ncbi:MAG: hypothetical protein COA63_001765 [Methylophaga sp.]|nr:hypothetical protein [Methylophaga sp.]
MADDVEVNADEGVIDEAEGSEETEEKTGFLKSKLFKIIAGVIVLLLIAGGGAYFFLAPEDETEEPVSDAVSEESIIDKEDDDTAKTDDLDLDNLENDLDLNPIDTSPEADPDEINSKIEDSTPEEQAANLDIVEFQEKTDALQQENLRMQQQIEELKAKISQQEKIKQDQQSNNNSNIIAPIRDPNSVDYQQDLFDESSMREPNRTPPPKPSWGEFDRINKK